MAMPKTEAEWKKKLNPEAYHVLREKGTEAAGTGKLLHNKETGMYVCGGCDAPLFPSNAKFESGTGWPSFDTATENVGQRSDDSYGMHRVEVYCKKCGGHLGHLFDDGPTASGKRFCINSCSLNFKKK
jgi:methionine-R-sulfoxide reductase